MKNGTRTLRSISGRILSLGAVGLTLWIVSERFPLSLTRYFDMDEFAYLSWSHQLLTGQKLYSEIIYYAGFPGFLWLLFPVHIFFKGGVHVLEAARLLSFSLYLALAFANGLLFWAVRKHWTALMVPLFFLFMPLPSDKFMEIRPDTPALLFVILGLVCQTFFMEGQRKGNRFVWFSVGAGLFYGLSLFTLSKMLPLVVIAVLVSIGWATDRGKGNGKRAFSLLAPFFGAVVGFGILTGLWCVTSTDLGFMWHSVIRAPFEINRFITLYAPWKYGYFYPNDVYFGTAGRHIGFTLTLWMWRMGVLTASFRLAFFLRDAFLKKKAAWQELLPALLLLFSVIFYFFILDIHHAQYLMPMAVFVAWYCGDIVYLVYSLVRRNFAGLCIFVALMAVLGKSLTAALPLEIFPKRYWGNAGIRELVETIQNSIPAGEPVFDLVGFAFSRRSPHPLSNVPAGQFQPYLTRSLPSVREALTATDTKYIVQGGTGRIGVLLPDDLTWVTEHYTPVLNGAIYVRNDVLPSYQESLRSLKL